MKILITGRNGFWGKHQADFLEAQGCSICSVGRSASDLPDHSVIDMGDASAWAAVLKEQQPDIILHLAGMARGDHDEMLQVNVQNTQALLEGCRLAKWGGRGIFLVGSGAEYGDVETFPITEDSPCNPLGSYGVTKLEQTRIGLEAFERGLPVTVLRPFNVLGTGMPPRLFLADVITQLRLILKGEAEPSLALGDLSTVRDFIDVRDLCEATYKLMNTNEVAGEVVNLCSGQPTEMSELLNTFLQVAQLDHVIVHTTKRGGGIPLHYGSPEKLHLLTGFTSRRSLEDTLQWIADFEFKEQNRG